MVLYSNSSARDIGSVEIESAAALGLEVRVWQVLVAARLDPMATRLKVRWHPRAQVYDF